MKILSTLEEADCWFADRPRSPDSVGNERVDHLSPYIRAVGRHRSGDIWIASDSTAGHDMLVATVDNWLPMLSGQLTYIQKTYPVIVHGVPTSCKNGEDIAALLTSKNADIITNPVALKHTTFLGHNHS